MKLKHKEWLAGGFFTLIAFFALHQVLAMHAAAQTSGAAHGVGDWAAWFGATGTIAAAGIALWIAGLQERTRRSIEFTQGSIVAARLAPKLMSAYLGLGSFNYRLEFEASDSLPPDTNEVANVLLQTSP